MGTKVEKEEKASRRLAAIVESSDDAIIGKDLDGIITSWNSGAEHIYGYSIEEAVGQPISMLVPPNRPDEIPQILEKIKRGENVDHFETVRQTKKGDLIDISLTISPIKGDDGAIIGASTIARNITERRKLEKEKDRFLHDIGELVKELNCLYNVSKLAEDPKKTLDDIFQGTVDLIPSSWQYPEATCARVIFEGAEFKTKNFVETKWRQSADIIASGKKKGVIEVYYLEEKAESAEGPFLKEERHLIDDLARQLAVITERKRWEEALQSAEEDWHNSFNSLEDIMLIIDKDYNIENINENGLKFLGKNKEEVIGKKCYQVVHNTEKPDKSCPFRKTLKTKKVESIERYEDLFGRHFSIKSSPIFDENGEIIKFVDLMRDITKAKKVEDQIKTSLKEKNVLLKEIHHRVKNNLQIVTTLLELQSDYIKDEKAIERFNEIQNRVHAMALVHEKLYQSKNLSEIDFKEYTQDLLDDLFRTYGAGSEVATPIINIDDIFLNVNTAIPCALIINELVSNSLKHAFPDGRKGEINIDLYLDTDNKFKLIVSDNGVGLQEDIDFRNTKSLGLQLVNNLVNQLDGSIEYHGKDGATFEITFTELK